jgi:RNA-directed DNA polymerase
VGGVPQDLEGLSNLLGFAPQHLRWLIGKADDLYREFDIPKRSGGTRRISAPILELKGVQRSILKKVLLAYSASDEAFAYVKGRSAVAAAKRLSGRKNILKLDLADFFPTISSKRIFGLMKSFGYNNKVSYMLTKLCTCHHQLSQGAPTSPHIANLISRKMDSELGSLAESWELEYLRYSDDLYFFGPEMFNWGKLFDRVQKIVRENGFRIQRSKTRFYCRGRNRMTLGLETSRSAPKFPRSQMRIYRAAFYRASKNPKWAMDNLDKLNGMLAWHKLVYDRDDRFREYQGIIAVAKRLKLHEAFAI